LKFQSSQFYHTQHAHTYSMIYTTHNRIQNLALQANVSFKSEKEAYGVQSPPRQSSWSVYSLY